MLYRVRTTNKVNHTEYYDSCSSATTIQSHSLQSTFQNVVPVADDSPQNRYESMGAIYLKKSSKVSALVFLLYSSTVFSYFTPKPEQVQVHGRYTQMGACVFFFSYYTPKFLVTLLLSQNRYRPMGATHKHNLEKMGALVNILYSIFTT